MEVVDEVRVEVDALMREELKNLKTVCKLLFWLILKTLLDKLTYSELINQIQHIVVQVEWYISKFIGKTESVY